MTFKIILVLPCVGEPYIWKNLAYKIITEKMIQDAVHGYELEVDASSVGIHPMFANRWRIASDLLEEQDVKVYVNEYGADKCSVNMASIRYTKDFVNGAILSKEQWDKLPMKVSETPYFGDIILTVPFKTLIKHINPDCMKLVGRVYAKPTGRPDEKEFHWSINKSEVKKFTKPKPTLIMNKIANDVFKHMRANINKST